jgi:Zn-dependent metalloprotease
MLQWFRDRLGASPEQRLDVTVQVGERSNTAFYFQNMIRLGAGDGDRYEKLAYDPSLVMHEVGHAIVARYAGLPPDGEGGSINEGFADFFAATLLENPRMGDLAFKKGPYVRTLENSARAPTDLGAGLYGASLVVSGTLWDLRQALGPDKGELLAFRALCRLGAGAKFSDFAPALESAAQALFKSGLETHSVAEVISARGWPKAATPGEEARL